MATWTAYREKRGSLNVGMRLEQLFAISDYRRFQAHDKTASFEKLIRFHDPDEPEVVTLEDIAKLLGTPYEVKQHGR